MDDGTRTLPFKKGMAIGISVACLTALATVLRAAGAMPDGEQDGARQTTVGKVGENGQGVAENRAPKKSLFEGTRPFAL